MSQMIRFSETSIKSCVAASKTGNRFVSSFHKLQQQQRIKTPLNLKFQHRHKPGLLTHASRNNSTPPFSIHIPSSSLSILSMASRTKPFHFNTNSMLLSILQRNKRFQYQCYNLIFSREVLRMILLCSPFLSMMDSSHNCQCESMLLYPSNSQILDMKSQSTVSNTRWKHSPNSHKKNQIKRALKVMKRVLQLVCAFIPMAALYPIHHLLSSVSGSQTLENGTTHEVDHDHGMTNTHGGSNKGFHLTDWYLKLCLQCVEWSGASVIKLMQWASSRPDLFGSQFCSIFGQLQDHTTPHSFSHTRNAMQNAFGSDWEKNIQLFHVIGSGCIGQVYKGQIVNKEGQIEDVAVKVIHPNVRENIDTDLDILRVLAFMLDSLPSSFNKSLKWLNLPGFAEEFATMLKIQLDLRTEARHLNHFNQNFDGNPHVIFPKVVNDYEAHPDVLIETFCEGIPLMDFVNKNKHNEEQLINLCNKGIRAVCQMIFEDNFVHADLHPGNIFVSPCGEKLIVLDAGIVTEYNDSDHELLINILKSFIIGDGRRAGELMISDSNDRLMKEWNEAAVDSNGYIHKIETMVNTAFADHRVMEHLGNYITMICDAAASHHVLMNQSFISMCLAVKVQEGVALALNPSVEIWKVANPIIMRTDFNRRTAKYVTSLQNKLGSVLSLK